MFVKRFLPSEKKKKKLRKEEEGRTKKPEGGGALRPGSIIPLPDWEGTIFQKIFERKDGVWAD